MAREIRDLGHVIPGEPVLDLEGILSSPGVPPWVWNLISFKDHIQGPF